jgi:MFS family permease
VVVTRSIAVLLVAKSARTFAYGALGVVLPVHLSGLGFGAAEIGLAVTLMLVASAALTWAVRRPAERWGPRAALLALAALGGVAALLLVAARAPWTIVLGAMLGNVAVGTGETGPFLALEQVLIARAVPAVRRTLALSVYNLLGYVAAGVGAAAVGLLGGAPGVFAAFVAAAGAQAVLYAALPDDRPLERRRPRLARPSAPLIRRLAALFALDSFAGGFVLQSLVAYWLHARHGLDLTTLGMVFFVAQLLTGLSLLLAVRAAARFGLLATMVVSHLVSNLVLIALAAAPTAVIAVALLWLRHLLSQMDVPTRQAYVMAIVEDQEREAAASLTNAARTTAQAITPALTGWVMQAVALSAPFVLGGALKIVYDVLLWVAFRDVPLPDEPRGATAAT